MSKEINELQIQLNRLRNSNIVMLLMIQNYLITIN